MVRTPFGCTVDVTLLQLYPPAPLSPFGPSGHYRPARVFPPCFPPPRYLHTGPVVTPCLPLPTPPHNIRGALYVCVYVCRGDTPIGASEIVSLTPPLEWRGEYTAGQAGRSMA